jgi:uncharacterized membrane protein YebE (DUF533 family)
MRGVPGRLILKRLAVGLGAGVPAAVIVGVATRDWNAALAVGMTAHFLAIGLLAGDEAIRWQRGQTVVARGEPGPDAGTTDGAAVDAARRALVLALALTAVMLVLVQAWLFAGVTLALLAAMHWRTSRA